MMRLLSALAVVLCTANAAVVDLDASTFDAAVSGSQPTFVKFYAPWYVLMCAH